MTSDRGVLTFWKGLSGEIHGYSLQDVVFVGTVEESDDGRTYEVDGYYSFLELEGKLPTNAELHKLLSEGHVAELVVNVGPRVNVTYRLLVESSRDHERQTFEIDGIDYEFMAQDLSSPPWDRAPVEGETVWVGGNAAVV